MDLRDNLHQESKVLTWTYRVFLQPADTETPTIHPGPRFGDSGGFAGS